MNQHEFQLNLSLKPLSNNLNSFRIAFASRSSLQLLGLIQCGWVFIEQSNMKTLIFLVYKEDLFDRCLEVSHWVYSQYETKEIHCINPKFTVREFSEGSLYNYLPNDIKVAQMVEIALISSKNCWLLDHLTFQKLSSFPFLCKQGDQFYLRLNQNIFPYGINKKSRRFSMLSTQDSLLHENIVHFKIFGLDCGEYFIVDPKNPIKIRKVKCHQFKFSQPQYNLEQKRITQLTKQIYKLQPFKELKTILQHLMKNNLQSSLKIITLISKKNIGKRIFLKLLCQKYGFSYQEKDSELITQLKQLETFFMRGIDHSPSLLLLRNFKSLQSPLSLKYNTEITQHLERYWIEQIKKLQKISQEKDSHFPTIIVLHTTSIDGFNYLVTNSDFVLQIEDKDPQIPKLVLASHSLNQNTEQILEMMQQLAWRQCDKMLKKLVNPEPQQIIKSLEGLSRSESINVKTTYADVGGMEQVLAEISKTIQLPLEHPEIFDRLVRPRRGVLFFGPPGTGKTLMAKCIATECKMNFISVKGPEMLNMYIGESEKNIRDLFQRARQNSPCIVFFDELDALAPARGNRSDSNQVTDRLVAQLLTEIDQIEDNQLVFVIGATNRPDLLDQSLLTPGRFDKLIYLGIKQDDESRIKILKAQTRKQVFKKKKKNIILRTNIDINFQELIKLIPPTFTGADFSGLTSAALLIAASRIIEQIKQNYDEKNCGTYQEYLQHCRENKQQIVISTQDFIHALPKIRASVTEEELEKYNELQSKFCNKK